MSAPTTPPPAGPTAVEARALGPDLARGLLLLFIALANVHGFLHPPGVSSIRNMPVASDLADQIVAFVDTTLVDGRSYTMFAALFGYGMVQLARRQRARGEEWPSVRSLLRRRSRWLIGFGILHAILLFYGDILAAYGLLALVFVPAVRRGGRRLLVWAAVWGVIGAVAYGIFSTPSSPEDVARLYPWAAEHNPLLAMGDRAVAIVVSAPVLAITAAGAFLFGVWAAHRKLYEEPERHRRLLRRMVAVGIPLSFLGGIPLALYTSGILTGGAADVVPTAFLHSITGLAGGPAYAALIALWASRVRRGRVVTALQATGQRSLTCYVSQSLVWAICFFPFLLDLGPRMALWQTVPLAFGTWASTVVVADLMRRAGQRGPLEVLLRRLTYRRPRR